MNQGAGCCGPSIPGLRMFTFPDGSKAGVTGLDQILEDLFREGKEPDSETASEIVKRLASKNYIAPTTRKQYEDVLLKEYQKFYESKKTRRVNTMPEGKTNQDKEKRGFLSRLFGGGGCCNVQIVPKEEAEEIEKNKQKVKVRK